MVNFDRLADVTGSLGQEAKLLQPCGIKAGDVQRFITAWGLAVSSVPVAQRPRGAVLILRKSSSTVPLPKPEVMRDIVMSVAKSQQDKEILAIELAGTIVERLAAPAELLRPVPALEWVTTQVGHVSAGSLAGECVLWVSNVALKAYVNGVEVYGYSDVTDRTLDFAAEATRRQGWNDGELLLLCGQRDLCNRTRLGIWQLPDHFLLKPRPEELMEERLDYFLRSHLTGYDRIIRQYEWENDGRLDLFIVLANGLKYIVELKWIGRSLKAKHESKGKTAIEGLIRKAWVCGAVTVFDGSKVASGLEQLVTYLETPDVHKGYLLVYDCRMPDMISAAPVDIAKIKAPDGLQNWQYKILHVPVDPRVPSSATGSGVRDKSVEVK